MGRICSVLILLIIGGFVAASGTEQRFDGVCFCFFPFSFCLPLRFFGVVR
jgi:hypothetical protein